MHMADALLSPAVAGVMYAGSVAAAGYSVCKVKKIEKPESVPVMGVMGAFVFAAQMINFTIPGTGSSGHLCGGMMLSAMLGPEAGFLTMIGVLLIQCLLFADGGLMALGANIWNMAFYGCFVGGYLIWKVLMKNGMSKKKITLASILGCILTLQLGAFSVTLQTLASGITELPFTAFVAVMQPIHLAIGLVEGLITAAVLVFIYEMRPAFLWSGESQVLTKREIVENKEVKESSENSFTDVRKDGQKNGQKNENRMSYKNLLILLTLAAVFLGGVCSLFASTFPDGLEWSLEKIAGTAELEQAGAAYEISAGLQEATALMPDYALKGTDSILGTTLSGLLGGIVVILLCVAACYGLKMFRKSSVK